VTNKALNQILASAIGIIVLGVIVTTAVAWTSSDEVFVSAAVICNLWSIAVALAVWTGVLRSKKHKLDSPESWSPSEWLYFFPGGIFVSVIFLLIDCGGQLPVFHPQFVCNGHPGFGAIFTISTITMTAIALPSAIRAWLLSKLGDKNPQIK